MNSFVIEGGHRLSGAITVAGNKNAALPMLAATLLTDAAVTLKIAGFPADVIRRLQECQSR